MDNIIKKQKEYEILRMIYKNEKINAILSEEPDFILENKNEKFGVEVTEYYFNESSARLKNYKGYSEKILQSKSQNVLDKRDRGFIQKVGLYIKNTSNNKYEFLMDTINTKYNNDYEFGQLPQYDDVEKQIVEIIKKKNIKSQNYNKELDYIELFIKDQECYLEKHLYEINGSKNILKVVENSGFKRIYIFSGKHLFIFGTEPEENMKKYNN